MTDISIVDDAYVDTVRAELHQNPYRWTSSNPRLVAAIRYLIEVKKLEAALVPLRLNIDKTRAAVIGFCARTIPRISFPNGRRHVVHGGGRPRKSRNSGNSLSTHQARLQDRISVNQRHDDDPDLAKPCPRCYVPAGFSCVAVAGGNKSYVVKTHKERLDADSNNRSLLEQMWSRRAKRRSAAARPPVCCWAGCTTPVERHHPYCLSHQPVDRVIAARPINFGRKYK